MTTTAAAWLNLTPEFRSSYKDSDFFPENLFDPHSYAPTLRAYKHRIDSASAQLFVQHEDVVDVPFRDLDGSSGAVTKKNIFSDLKLRAHLGDTAVEDPVDSPISLGSSCYGTRPEMSLHLSLGETL